LRVRIIFNLKNKGAVVPFHHQYLLSDFVKKIIGSAGAPYLFFNDYNFSGLKGQTRVSKLGLHFYSSKVTLVLSSPDNVFLDVFLKLLFNMSEVEIGKLQLEPFTIQKEEIKKPDETVKFVCISPVVISIASGQDLEHKKFIQPSSDVFSDLLYESTMDRMAKSGRYTTDQIAGFYKFQFVPDADYLDKIKSEEKKFSRIYPVYNEGEMEEVRGYTLPFTLYASQEVQNFLLNYGLGNYTNKGFGMLDFADSTELKTVVSYNLEQIKQLS